MGYWTSGRYKGSGSADYYAERKQRENERKLREAADLRAQREREEQDRRIRQLEEDRRREAESRRSAPPPQQRSAPARAAAPAAAPAKQPFNPGSYSPVPENPSEDNSKQEKIDTSSRGSSNFITNYLTSAQEQGRELGSTFRDYAQSLRKDRGDRSGSMERNSLRDYGERLSEGFTRRSSDDEDSTFRQRASGAEGDSGAEESEDDRPSWDRYSKQWGYGSDRMAGGEQFLQKLKRSSGAF